MTHKVGFLNLRLVSWFLKLFGFEKGKSQIFVIASVTIPQR